VQLTPLEITLLVLTVLGALACLWLWSERYQLLAQRDLARQRLADLTADEERMRDSFRSLASETLQQSNSQFLQLAERTLAVQKSSAAADLDRRRSAVDELVKPIHQVLQKAERQLRQIEKDRAEAYTGLRTQVQGMAATGTELRRETAKLARAMSRPNMRGRYGEIQLQRVAELAGMQAYCDFAVQSEVRDDEGRVLRPDMVVTLPNGRVLAVDAKTSLDAYVEALGADNDADREIALDRFAENVLRQVKELARRGYWRQYSESPEFVVMFIPGDQFIDAALERRPELIETSAQLNVVLASPSTLIGLLRAVHVGWREKQLSEGAHELFALGRELHERVANAMTYAAKLGESLEQTVRRYNSLVGSVESRVLPTLRKFEERGVRVGEEARALKPVEGLVREPSGATLQPRPPAGGHKDASRRHKKKARRPHGAQPGHLPAPKPAPPAPRDPA